MFRCSLLAVVPLGPLSFGLFTAVTVLCFPVAAIKTCINVIQLGAACQNVVALDNEDRKLAKANLAAGATGKKTE